MKKFLTVLTLFLLSAICVCGLFACGGVEFKINFIVDGEVYAVVNTNGAETVKMPDNPEKAEYTFDGWFWDKDTWEKPFTANSILDAPLSSDMNVYAKFKSNHIHEYTKQITKEPTCLEKGEKTFTCDCGDSYTEEINALEHEFINYISDNNATYESDGTKTAVCERGCGATDTIPDVGTKLPEIEEYFTKQQDGSYYGKVFNNTKTFDFTGKIETAGEYFVCTDEECKKPLADNKTSLILGDNKFYVLYENGQKTTATVRRRLIYTVNFDSNGGTELSKQQVEEDRRATAPKNPMRVGYTFNTWDRDFNEPITENTTITALWNANTNTPYKIEYYLQNLEDNNYTLQESDTEYLTGTTDTIAMATKTYEHFTVIENTVSANISPDGTTVLQVRYTRDRYNIRIISNSSLVTINNSFNSQYKYGYIIPTIKATFNNYLGYEWKGWQVYAGELITYDFTIPSFAVDKEINYVATCTVKQEMSNFYFNSTTETCFITGVKDTTIKEITVPDYVTSIGESVFYGCTFEIKWGENTSIKSIGKNVFNGYKGTTITIPDSVTYIGDSAFKNCNSLTNVTIGNGVKSIGDNAFYHCNDLTYIRIPDSITSIGNCAFLFCYKLVEVINNSSLNIQKGGSDYGYVGYYALNVKNGGSSDIENKNGYLFYTNDNVNYLLGYVGSETELALPDNYNGHSYEIYKKAFYGCKCLTSITIPESVTSIGDNAFFGCSYLTNVSIPNSFTSIEFYAFGNCISLPSITIPESITSIRNYAFYGCSSLTSITIPNSVTSIGNYAFYGCSSLTSITIPDGVTSIGDGVFSYCSSLEGITIPENVTSIESHAFSGCTSLTNITIPDSVTSIGHSAFYGCSSLTSIKFIDNTSWYMTNNSTNWQNKTGGTRTNITNSSTNATYFKSTYWNYYWYKI